nr:bromodomain adjacent to zinc finger domain protein 2B isoform X4 [Halyomorpha halys]
MEKENAPASADREKDRPTPNLLDAASLFGTSYWPRPDGSNAGGANPLFGGYPGAYSGLMGRGAGGAYPSNPYGTTLSVAASQAANLGINPAWWNMASQIAAQDYLASLQFAGLASNIIPPYPMIATPPHLSGGKSSHSKSSSSSSTPPTSSVPVSSQPPTTSSRLPPDTEIIKYTSSIVGPKIPGTTNRGRKKTISLDMPNMHGSKTSKSSSILPKPFVGLDLSGKSKEIASVDDSPYRYGPDISDKAEVIRLGGQTNGQSSPQPADEGPLNLSLKPVPERNNHNNSALQSLSALSQTLGQTDRNRRKPGPKPRRLAPYLPSDSSHPSSGSEENDTTPHKDGRPRNLGRGVSKPKKNTVASLLAQSRALGIKPGLEMAQLAALAKCSGMYPSNAQDPLSWGSSRLPGFNSSESALDKEKEESNLSSSPNSIFEHPQPLMTSKSEDQKSLGTDGISEDSRSEISDSSSESDGEERKRGDSISSAAFLDGAPLGKRRKIIDEAKLREALQKGWKRETFITSVGRGGVKGEVVYTSPCGRMFRHLGDLARFLEKHGSELTRDNFSFSCRILLGDYIESVEGKEPMRLSEETLAAKLQEMMAQHRAALDQNKLERDRLALAAKEARRLAKEEAARQKEQMRLIKEQERTERQEAARKEKEQRSQQLMEARKKKQEELERQRLEGQQRKQQERELKRQQAAIMKEQMYIQELNKQREILYTVELERERRRQHMGLVKALEVRKRLEEREKKRLEQRAEKLATREKRIEQRKVEVELLRELRRPVEDMELNEIKPLPDLERIPGLKLSGQAFADTLMTFEFLHNFGETLGFDTESLPTLNSLQEALLGESEEAEEELLSVITQLVICGIEDPGIPHPARHTTLLSHSLKQADISHSSLSEILRIYLYANATGELKATTGVHFEREREKRVTEHHNNMGEIPLEETLGKNSAFFTLLKENNTYKMSEWLKKRSFLSLNPTKKAAILAFLCHELLQNKAVIRQIDSAIETVAQLKRERWPIEANLRKLKHLQARKNKTLGITGIEKQEVMQEDEAEVESCNESDITQPEDEELSRLQVGESLAVVSKQAEVNTKALLDYGSKLRAVCVGQDRYCRRYWCLSTGIYVEALESADPELFNKPEGKLEQVEEPVKMEMDTNDDEEEVNDHEEEKMDDSRISVKEEINSKEGDNNKESSPVKEEDSKDFDSPEKAPSHKSLQFERLGECMEKESNAVNGCISHVNNNSGHEDLQWFSILPKEPCDSTSLVSSQPGFRCWSDSGELRIPVPQGQYSSPCPSPLPLPLSVEEAALLDHCKTYGLPKPGTPKPIPEDLRRGWWRISMEKMKEVAARLEPRGVREREFMASITRMRTEHAWDSTLKVCTTSGDSRKCNFKIKEDDDGKISEPDPPESWNREVALRVDLAALVAVEALEEKVASASMQLKGWKVPAKASTSDIPFVPACEAVDSSVNPIYVAKERLSNLFEAIERRYLKPPLGQNIGDLKLSSSCNPSEDGGPSNESKGLTVWREALSKSQTAAQISMVLHALEASIAWDKSIMKAVSPTPQNAQTNCQFCHSGDNEDKLLLCDGCDKGYHTYCFKPKMENIPEGDWFCHQCLNKAKGEKNCVVCGKKIGRNLLICEMCPIAFHTDCMTPPLSKMPRGKWYCTNCAAKHPKRKTTRRSQTQSLSPIKSEEMTNSTESLHVPTEEDTPTKRDNKTGKRLNKELAPCKAILDDLESHEDAWPFLIAVNTKQFPTYRKIIRNPMDLQTISKRLSHNEYKSRDDFVSDVRLIFDNCETFNEDNSPVGKAGHSLRLYFETKWAELTNSKQV